jgi:2-polyprenyl-6-methoxyphenol hydroxylase-like FAD-dependent oxidoreductase
MTDKIYDVIQLGRGPVGMTSAALIAQSGHSVALVEKHTGLYGHPRAGHIDHEIARVLASVDCADTVLADAEAPMDYVWKNAKGEVLIEFAWGAKGVSGYNADYMMFMPLIDRALADKLERDPRVDMFCGWQAVDFIHHDDHVELVLRKTEHVEGSQTPVVTDEETRLRGRYMIASDGANSPVRRQLGIEQDDLGFNERWLIVDARRKRELRRFDPDCGQICDPRRPVTILPLGKRHRRWEWCMFENETPEEFQRPEKAWELLAEQGVTPDDVEIIRQLPYVFSARLAKRWREGRIFLMGDAAHTMPPFMGQGMCSGIRDAANLSWKLDLVLRGVSVPDILRSYQEERYPHVRDWTLISIESGKLPCTVDPRAAEERDERFRQGWRPPMPNFPKLVGGLLHREADGNLRAPTGELAVQAPVKVGERFDLLDAFQPRGKFVVLSTVAHPATSLAAAQLAALEPLGVVFCHVGERGQHGADAVDLEGRYAAYFAQHAIEVLVIRPDFYVFAGCSLSQLPIVLDDLIAQLGLRDARVPTRAAAADALTR